MDLGKLRCSFAYDDKIFKKISYEQKYIEYTILRNINTNKEVVGSDDIKERRMCVLSDFNGKKYYKCEPTISNDTTKIIKNIILESIILDNGSRIGGAITRTDYVDSEHNQIIATSARSYSPKASTIYLGYFNSSDVEFCGGDLEDKDVFIDAKY